MQHDFINVFYVFNNELNNSSLNPLYKKIFINYLTDITLAKNKHDKLNLCYELKGVLYGLKIEYSDNIITLTILHNLACQMIDSLS